jgi:hypothetical protein
MKPETQPLLTSADGKIVKTVNKFDATPKNDPNGAAKKFSVLPLLVIVVISFSFAVIGVSYHNGIIVNGNDALLLLLGPTMQAIYAFLVMHAGGKHQIFLRQGMLQSFPIIWLPLVALTPLAIVSYLRWNLVLEIVDNFPTTLFTALQAVRMLAVGSIIKWKMGIFPTAFAWGTAFPDMLFGLSAVFLLVFQSHQDYPIQPMFLLLWNLTGFAIILPFGVSLLQLGMAPTKLYESNVSNDVVFEYPMVLGPALVVPTLLGWNGVVAGWALSQL